ncbi:hypothetical protein Lal_00027788 [Lupinus albus]|uniref:Uncharacterized protein n=1 Tax=Lupinus albus TaxID=3870 RepID=A0A6A5MR92_LUPAL|nr:hypothetical protein Lalb_Chr05g0214801 [Lupinus albus]KAF1873750.1 hypothetical protein Lal_00027788 [Lupinus albus]
MGGLLHFFEFNQGRMAKKVHAHKKNHGGLAPPRNRLDLQAETSQNHNQQRKLPYSYEVEDWSENNCYSNVASMKNLINEELSKGSSTRQNVPSLVARLMGIDMMPVETKSVVPPERIRENMGKKLAKKGMNGNSLVSWGSPNFNYSNQMEFDSFYGHTYDAGWSPSFREARSQEHPQEEELQKFKKEFEAYQAARFVECSKVADIGSAPRRLLAHENLNTEKVAHNASSQRAANEKLAEYGGDMTELIPTMPKQAFPCRSRTLSRDFEECLTLKSKNRLDRSSSPTQIVILKPGLESICNKEESWSCSSRILQGSSSIEEFLEEVKERLKCELQGKTVKKCSVVGGSGIESPYTEKPCDHKLIACHIVKQVTRDTESNLLRSESARSYTSEMQFNGPSSPEFINRDTRRFLSERLRNIMKCETHVDIPEMICRNSSSNALDDHRVRLNSGDIIKCANGMSYSEEEKQMQTGSFRHEPEPDENTLLHCQRELSPRNLVRSLSAPVSGSGTSFRKLLLEDRHILTGAQIQRKVEADDVKKLRKDRFNMKEKVSNFRYSLNLRGNVFGKRNQSMAESHVNKYVPMVRDVRSGPTVLMNCGDWHENSTEVPPSPASMCSSVHDEHWRQVEYLSPISTPDMSSRDNNVVSHVFRDISSALNEVRKKLSQLESDSVNEFITKQEAEPDDSELVQIEDPAESYIRDLLIASGLYFGSWDKSLLRGDTFAKPIGNSVFEEVEASHKKLVKKSNDRSIKDHKVLLDLLNEALSLVLGPPLTRKICNSSVMQQPYGKELLKLVWDIIRVSLHPPCDICPYSLDTLVAQHLESIPWSGLVYDEINVLGRDIECLITRDLVEEITKDIMLSV